MEESYSGEQTNRVDGLKIDFEKGWIHLRKSNTEPIIRIYAEAETKGEAEAMIGDLMMEERRLIIRSSESELSINELA